VKAVFAVGLNPSWQKTLRFESFRYGGINRASELTESAAGKGVNAARAIRLLCGRVVVFQFAGGVTGGLLQNALDAEGIEHVTVNAGGRTRVCTTILNDADGSMTELIEPATSVPPEARSRLLGQFEARLTEAGAAALCGTYPPGIPDEYPARLVRAALRQDVPVVLDGVHGVGAALAAGAHVLKINREEMAKLTGLDEPDAAIKYAFEHWPLKVVVTTDGGAPTCVAFRDRMLRIQPPAVQPVRNPLGAGDCVTGVLAWRLCEAGETGSGLASDEHAVERFVGFVCEALACASASCLTVRPAEFDPAVVEDLVRRTREVH